MTASPLSFHRMREQAWPAGCPKRREVAAVNAAATDQPLFHVTFAVIVLNLLLVVVYGSNLRCLVWRAPMKPPYAQAGGKADWDPRIRFEMNKILPNVTIHSCLSQTEVA
jgi:hypothetical protein